MTSKQIVVSLQNYYATQGWPTRDPRYLVSLLGNRRPALRRIVVLQRDHDLLGSHLSQLIGLRPVSFHASRAEVCGGRSDCGAAADGHPRAPIIEAPGIWPLLAVVVNSRVGSVVRADW